MALCNFYYAKIGVKKKRWKNNDFEEINLNVVMRNEWQEWGSYISSTRLEEELTS